MSAVDLASTWRLLRSPWRTVYSNRHIVTIAMTHYLQQWPYCHDRHDTLSTAVAILSRSPWRIIYRSGHTVMIAMTHYLQQWPYCHDRRDILSTEVAILSRSPWHTIYSSGHIVMIAIKQSPCPCIILRLGPIFLSYVITQTFVSPNWSRITLDVNTLLLLSVSKLLSACYHPLPAHCNR